MKLLTKHVKSDVWNRFNIGLGWVMTIIEEIIMWAFRLWVSYVFILQAHYQQLACRLEYFLHMHILNPKYTAYAS